MIIKKILIKNYKKFDNDNNIIEFNEKCSILVGENDAGKSTIIEALMIGLTGKLNGQSIEKALKSSLFNYNAKVDFLNNRNSIKELPKIIIEIYFSEDDFSIKGTNNELREDTCGIRVSIEYSDEYAALFNKDIKNNAINDIPIEYYIVNINYFNGNRVNFKLLDVNTILIDTTKKEYFNIFDKYIQNNLSSLFTEEQLLEIANSYRTCRSNFSNTNLIKSINDITLNEDNILHKQVAVGIKEDNFDDWKKQLGVIVDDLPFENLGFGSQNVLKIELALKNLKKSPDIILLEEPENNLTFSNMNKMVNQIMSTTNKQIFISTHSSFIINKLNINNVIIVSNGKTSSLSNLNDEDVNFFIKCNEYDTLRFLLSNKCVMVEGYSDSLIIQRAYFDKHKCLPIEHGIYVLVVNSLSFKRFCELAKITKKDIYIVTDNDGNIENNIKRKYKEYENLMNFNIFYEKNEQLNTLEPSVLRSNCDFENKPNEEFLDVIKKNNNLSYEDILKYMVNNKTEWAYQVFSSNNIIKYPQYICDVVEKLS